MRMMFFRQCDNLLLGGYIAELTEDLEELRSEKALLLQSLQYAGDTPRSRAMMTAGVHCLSAPLKSFLFIRCV